MQVVREDVGVLVDSSVLHNGIVALLYLPDLPEPCIEEIHLQVKGPPRHVVIKIPQIRILVY